jgi:hypothetical protein
MKLQILLKALLASAVLVAVCSPSMAQVKINEGNGVNITMENEALKLNIAVEAGGRISSFIDKKTGRDWVTLWKGGAEDGGLLDDRNVFTSYNFRAVVSQPGGEVGAVRLIANHPDGMSLVKTLTLRRGGSTLEVSETFSNGTQQPARFMLRSFLLPGGEPQNDANQYFLPLKEKPLLPLSAPNAWFDNLAAPWSALWNQKTGAGLLVAAPGVEKFYFWQGSKIFPTYEWVYPDVPAGKAATVNYALQLVHDTEPDWAALSTAVLKGLRSLRVADVPGWQNEEQRFQVTDAERARGFWFSVGNGKDKRRLPQTLRLDVPLGQSRSAYIAFNALKAFAGDELKINFLRIPTGLVQSGWEVSGKDVIKVSPLAAPEKISLKNGTEGRLWLTLRGGAQPVEAKGEIEISLGGQRVLLPLEVKVWPVQVPATRPFDVRGYGNFATMAGGYKITPQTLQQTDAMLDHFQAIGGNVLDWTVAWSNMYPYLKIAGSEQSVTSWLKQNRADYEKKSLAEWPQVDFSYYDPWLKSAKAHGVTSVSTYLGNQTHKGSSPQLDEWILSQLKTYLQAQGMSGFFCKIGDENAPEDTPDYIEQAKLARRAGWRPTTTVTGQVARTAAEINRINPYLDKWVLNLMTTQAFEEVIHTSYRVEEKTIILPSEKWGEYRNGGARHTVAQRVFRTLVPESPAEVESVQLLQDGKPLQRAGGSPWGNQKSGIFFSMLNDFIYVAPFEGTDAKKAKFTLKYQVRVPAEDGQSLAKIDPTDEIWFYGGLSHSYRHTYEDSVTYPLKALEGQYDGYAYYAFYRWDVDKVLWYDAATGQVSVGPAYLGLKDGWDDACLLSWLDKSKKAPLSRFISEKPDAPLRMGEVSLEVYRWKSIVNLTDPFKLNDARRQMLAAAS